MSDPALKIPHFLKRIPNLNEPLVMSKEQVDKIGDGDNSLGVARIKVVEKAINGEVLTPEDILTVGVKKMTVHTPESLPGENLEEIVKKFQKEVAETDAHIRALQKTRAAVSKQLRAAMGKLITKQLNEHK